jgi:hypothetical protein
MDIRLFATLLGVCLIVMRFAGIIDWHWMLVLFPFWPAMLFLAIAALAWTVVGIIWLFASADERKRMRVRRENRRFFALRARFNGA